MEKSKLAITVNRFMENEADRLLEKVPSANHLSDTAESLHDAYYIRHRIETVKRIWLTSRTDALSLAEMITENYDAARWWSKYIYQELNHDLLYLRDLQCHGVSHNDVLQTPTFISTLIMIDYIDSEIKKVGSIAAVAYSIWVEWNSDKISAIVVNHAQKKYSANYIKGSKAHVAIDVNEDHYQVMLSVADKLLQSRNSDILFELLYNYTNHFTNYFSELHQYTKNIDSTFAISSKSRHTIKSH